MTTGNLYGRIQQPGGVNHLDRIGTGDSALNQFLYPFAWRDVVFIFDDFYGGGGQEAGVANFDESLWQDGNNSGNGTLFKCPDTQLAGGVVQGVSGATGGDTIALWGMHTWKGDKNCGMELRWNLDNIDDVQWEIGLAAPYVDQKLTQIADIDGPTFVDDTDKAFVGMDTSESWATMAFVTDGSTTDMNATKTNLGTRTPTNSVYQIVRVQLTQVASAVAASSAYIFDQNQWLLEEAHHGSALASQIKGSVLLGPTIVVEAVTTSARTTNVDYIAVWQDR